MQTSSAIPSGQTYLQKKRRRIIQKRKSADETIPNPVAAYLPTNADSEE
ncbi:MAG: hypothetical protein IKX88_03045 [Thermoguttaceae bacterium]|nr:hypothetical protein [Thermoguttaceae bacterium]